MSRSIHPFGAASRLGIAGLALLALPATAAIAPQGREVRLNAARDSRQVLPTVAGSTAGPAVVWEHQGAGLRARFLAPGAITGAELTLVTNQGVPSIPFTGEIVVRREPAAAFGPGGALLVAWTEERASIRTEPFHEIREVVDQDVLVQRFDRTGAPLGRRFRVNASPAGLQSGARVAAHGTGYVVVWQDGASIVARALDSQGRPAGAETRVAAAGLRPELAIGSAGRALVVWDGDDDDEIGVHARLLDTSARAIGAAFRVNGTTLDKQARPTVAADAAGGFLVAWQSEHRELWNGFYYLYGQRVAGDGSLVGAELRLYAGQLAAGYPQIAPALTAGASGNFLLTWITWKNSFGPDVAGVELDAAGAVVGEAFFVTERRVKSTFRELAVGSDGNGGFLAAWESSDRRSALAARRLAVH